MDHVGRLFIGVALPDETRALLDAILRDWSGGRPLPGKPVPAANWHLTLRFLGRTDEIAFDRVVAALDRAEMGGPFAVELSGIGAFPGPRRATVLWLGVEEGGERLARLAEIAEEAARSAGIEPEERPYRPHLTLSRIRPQQDVRALIERDQPPPVRFRAEAVTLFRSHLGRPAARYEPLEAFPLTGSRA